MVGVAVKTSHPADLTVQQHRDGAVQHRVVGDDLLDRILARLDRAVERLVHALPERRVLRIDAVDAGAELGAIGERAGQLGLDAIHLLARAVGVPAIFVVRLRAQFRVDAGGPEQEIGGEAALGIEIARNVADGPNHFQPALRHRDLVHRLVFCHRDIDCEAAADGGQRNDGGG